MHRKWEFSVEKCNMRRNDQSNNVLKWTVIACDFILLNLIIFAFVRWHWRMETWGPGNVEIFILASNLALLLSQLKFPTVIHQRLVGAGDIIRKLTLLTSTQALLGYLLIKAFAWQMPVGWLLLEIGTVFFFLLVLARLGERWFIKLYRQAGRNSRTVLFVGTDPEQVKIYHLLMNDPTLGYRVVGFYGDELEGEKRLGSLDDLRVDMENPDKILSCDELYMCVSRREKELIQRASAICDHYMIHFYYVPVSVESIGLNFKREMMEDMEVFTTYENPLENPWNKFVKRVFDIVLSSFFLLLSAFLFPIVWLMIKIQSPGPLFFKQLRTGLDGKNFYCYKFRSMHVNADADKVQATKDDPRKYPFGNFMRKTNIDELPQFWNVLKGDMSIVGPRPHMLAHTEQYSQLIDKYMVRHFVKPGVTGWAQVTGYRGETKELWQMEGRVKRDIWYMEHWSIWLDIRIIWLTCKTFFVHDKNAY